MYLASILRKATEIVYYGSGTICLKFNSRNKEKLKSVRNFYANKI